jgi:hypothetical protein
MIFTWFYLDAFHFTTPTSIIPPIFHTHAPNTTQKDERETGNLQSKFNKTGSIGEKSTLTVFSIPCTKHRSYGFSTNFRAQITKSITHAIFSVSLCTTTKQQPAHNTVIKNPPPPPTDLRYSVVATCSPNYKILLICLSFDFTATIFMEQDKKGSITYNTVARSRYLVQCANTTVLLPLWQFS